MGREALRQLRVKACPGFAAVVAAGHRACGSAVVDAPDRQDGLAIREEQGRRMTLVDRLRSCTYDHLAFLLSGKVDHWQVRLFLGHDQ